MNRLVTLVAGMVLVALVADVEAAPVQWSGNGHLYEAISVPAGVTWSDAADSCRARGGYLASLTSAEEHAFVFGLVSGRPELWYLDGAGNGEGPWLGGFQGSGGAEPGGGWSWDSGESWSYTAWSPGEPNNSGSGEDRLDFFHVGGLIGDRWNDVSQGALERGYVVEMQTPASACTTWSGNGHGYRLVSTPARISWTNARDAAIAAGGHLATISTPEENTVVASLATADARLWKIDPAGNGQGPWIGGYQPPGSPEPGGNWSWVDGSPFAYTHWALGEPNNLNGVEHQLQLFGKGTLTGDLWNDMLDFTPYGGLAYIVEYESAVGCVTTDVGESDPGSRPRFALRPNPTTAATRVSFDLARPTDVSLDVFDVGGRLVRQLLRGTRAPAGAFVVDWDGRNEAGSKVSSGVYLIRIHSGREVNTRRVVVAR